MMKAKWKKYPFVMITYRDHSGDASFVSEKDMEQDSILLKTCGWLIKEDDKRVFLVDTQTSEGDFAGLSEIISSCIVERVTLRKKL